MTRTISVVLQSDGTLDVYEGECVAQSLTVDELLGELARIGLGQRPRYMKPIDEGCDVCGGAHSNDNCPQLGP